MLGIFKLVLAIDENIIEVGGTEFVEISSEGFVNVTLERSGAVI